VKVSRAAFLKTCGLALFGARVDARTLVGMATAESNPVEASGPGGRLRLQDATAALFRQHLNTAFAVRPADGTPTRMVLVKVIERPVTKNVEQFSLMFHAPAGKPAPCGTHAFQHSALGDFDLFVVPVGIPNGRRTVYQACFSRHLSARELTLAPAVSAPAPCWRT
jgi:hypothetical protein